MYGPHRFNIPQQCRLPMTEADIQHGKQLLQEDFIKANPKCAAASGRQACRLLNCALACRWVKELELMLETREKAEIRAYLLGTRGVCLLHSPLVSAQRRSAPSASSTCPKHTCRSSFRRCACARAVLTRSC